MADVLATVEVFHHLLKEDNSNNLLTSHINHGVKLSKLPGTITLEDIHAIPETAGVYYFFGPNDHLLYVGRSKNIRSEERRVGKAGVFRWPPERSRCMQ